MPFYRWTQAMSVGVEGLDSDHRVLIGLINLLAELVDSADAAALDGILGELEDYACGHFAREERLMRAVGYPQLDAHRAEHAAFAVHIEGMRKGAVLGADVAAAMALLEYLKSWLNHHVLILDMDYKPYLAGRGGGSEEEANAGEGRGAVP